MNTGFKHVYGPVPSRRLGRSLGVDALTFKSCSFDCVYCQLGRTTNHTIERKEYIPTADILDEVRRKLENGDKPEYISFAGSGEPTLGEPQRSDRQPVFARLRDPHFRHVRQHAGGADVRVHAARGRGSRTRAVPWHRGVDAQGARTALPSDRYRRRRPWIVAMRWSPTRMGRSSPTRTRSRSTICCGCAWPAVTSRSAPAPPEQP